jgi:peptidyl-prolyl cis-trans isomerase SurA
LKNSLINIFFSFVLFYISFSSAHAKLLDKISAVINNRVITSSEIKRIKNTLSARKEISGLIYDKKSYTPQDIVKLVWQSFIVRDKLSSLGYVISDDSVESRIQMTEKKLGLRREDLLEFLAAKNISFDEYFELMRQSMEYNIFTSKIIYPLIAITDQEVKNTFYREFVDKNTLSFSYHLVDYYIDSSKVTSKKDFRDKIKNFIVSGILEEKYKSVEASDLGKTKEDDLSPDIRKKLKQTDEGDFSKTLTIGKYVHIFFIKKKDLTESSIFLKKKNFIKQKIFAKKSKSITKSWFMREHENYYTKLML